MPRINLSGYVGHVTIFSSMFTSTFGVRIRFSVWLVSCYAHVFVIVTQRVNAVPNSNSRIPLLRLCANLPFVATLQNYSNYG